MKNKENEKNIPVPSTVDNGSTTGGGGTRTSQNPGEDKKQEGHKQLKKMTKITN